MGDLFSYATFLCFLVFLVILSLHLLSLLFKDNSTKSSTTLPPGKSGWPWIGESMEFLSSGRRGYPENFMFDRIKRYSSNVFRTHLFMENFVIICGAPGNRFLFSNENKLVRAWWPKSVVKIVPPLSSKEESIAVRKMLLHFFKPESLRSYISIMDSLAQKHFSSEWENKNEVVVFPLTKRYTFRVACRLFLSVEDPTQIAKFEEHFNHIATGLLSIPINLPGTQFRQAVNDSKFIRLELAKIIKQRKIDLGEGKATATQDLLSHMLLTSDEHGKFMKEIEIADSILGLLIAGHDTASSACTFVVKYLAELPEVYDGVYREQMGIAKSKGPGEVLNWDDIQKMKYSWNVACETMRLAPPIPGTFREAINDFTFNGFSIPKGWKLYWSANATHKDPEYFPDPIKFDPSRFQGSGPAPYTFVPFGGGPRMCPGMEYARLEILVFMHHLVRRFKWEKIIPDENTVINPMPVPAKGLPVCLYPHKARNIE